MAKLVKKTAESMEEDLISAKAQTEKRLYKLIDKWEGLGDEIKGTKLTLELIIARMDELGIVSEGE